MPTLRRQTVSISRSTASAKRAGYGSTSLLPSASKIVITGGSFVQNNDAAKEFIPLNDLYEKVAPNAILNAGGRADPVRCYPGTREEVIAKIEKWITVTHARCRGVFWLSGPAGAGKSAIIQTVAERCVARKVPMVNFFFFRADKTRNHAGSVVATLLFQLFELFPELRSHVVAIATKNPVIFRQSIQEQFLTLIEAPLLAIRQGEDTTPLVFLIDGLDECTSMHSKEDQASLLRILHEATTRITRPAFIVIVASRTEAHLTMTFNEICYHPDSIYLDNSYRPSDDIRIFLIEEFSRIKRTHSLRDALPLNWPHSTDLDAIIEKSSGQFVYAATISRFISNSPASPKRSLEIVLGLRLATRTSPFATIDSLYTYILSQAEDWSSVQDILATERIISQPAWASSTASLTSILNPLDYTEDDILSSLSDLTAIIRFHVGNKHLTMYHASLNDFLYDKQRAGDFYIDVSAFARRLAPAHFKQISGRYGLYCSFRILESVTETDERLTEFLKSFLPDHELFRDVLLTSDLERHWMRTLGKLYRSRNSELDEYEFMVNRWQEWFNAVHALSGTSTDGGVTEKSSPVGTPTIIVKQTYGRPSTPPSRCFPKLTLRRNRHGGSNPRKIG